MRTRTCRIGYLSTGFTNLDKGRGVAPVPLLLELLQESLLLYLETSPSVHGSTGTKRLPEHRGWICDGQGGACGWIRDGNLGGSWRAGNKGRRCVHQKDYNLRFQVLTCNKNNNIISTTGDDEIPENSPQKKSPL